MVDPRTAEDVSLAVRYAGEHRLTVGVMATGHGTQSGLAGDLLVNTSRLREVSVNPEGWARIGAGASWARVIDEAAPHGLAPLTGSSSGVGAVGFITGGGAGPLARTYGLASDHVRAFEVVTGDGRLRRVSAVEGQDLFTALRGGKGAAGIVTSVDIDLVRLSSFYGGALYFDGDDAPRVIDVWRRWADRLPDGGNTSFVLLRLPPLDSVPDELRGRLTLGVRFLWAGDPAEGRRWLDELRGVAPVILDDAGPKPFAAVDSVHADPVDPMPMIDLGGLLHEFTDEAAASLLAQAGPGADCPQVMVEIRHLGGAYAAPPDVPDAFDHRAARYSLLTVGLAQPGVRESHERLRQALAPWDTGGVWPNFGPPHDRDTAARAYRPETLRRLTAVVERHDPRRVIAAARYLVE
ncbi:FAD-binding oxidoreductase [Nocardioides sp. GCM10027113]|uniref:FAD-binding oxidoreductase n=1 Tax=unclassified Nocardioides TaxID=2615069 RepID=UPI0036082BFF